MEGMVQEAVSVTEIRKAWNENFYPVTRKQKANLHKVTVGIEKINK